MAMLCEDPRMLSGFRKKSFLLYDCDGTFALAFINDLEKAKEWFIPR